MGSKLALSAVAALLLVGCGGSEPEAGQPGTTQSEPGATATSAPSATPAGNVPEIAGTALDGKALDVTEYRGRPLFVNVWSSW
ncbi:MAG TPA: hypothetical protein VNI55_10475 [Gaiellaceae bacterium]|nr:hypothetical protein [Gaiellaceae bacterium]